MQLMPLEQIHLSVVVSDLEETEVYVSSLLEGAHKKCRTKWSIFRELQIRVLRKPIFICNYNIRTNRREREQAFVLSAGSVQCGDR